MKNEAEKIDNQQGNGVLPCVSGSFSAEDVKWLIMYGYNKDKTIDIRNEDKGELDYAISNMFQMLKDSTRFDADRVERVFWERVSALANYR